MNKTELIDAMASKTGMTKKNAEAALNAFVETVSEELVKGGKVALTGFGTFEARARKEREGKNPQNGEKVVIPAATIPAFKAGKAFKDAVNVK
ncbi:HU family DNA-binding protein [Phascolarctobacterium succinatutens]|uniref:HU family DNA-binding protein n=1 Tax=Phascolarctobacterium succinatutens TaxID=626940 RepID=UPI0026ECDC99|nr:HU family DNA-binding protein [Phascolarctobacterium succinatutens]